MTDAPSKHRKPCRWFHRWNSIHEAEWVRGIAYPEFLHTCKRCGATKRVICA